MKSLREALPRSRSLSRPSTATDESVDEHRVCIPGELLFQVAGGQYQAGNGCYEFHGAVYAALTGFVHVFLLKEEESDGPKVVEIRRKSGAKCCVVPATGLVVTARVDQVQKHLAKCAILCVEDTALPTEFCSTLRKEDVRDKERDKVDLYKTVQPGDIILARVLGYGESQTAYLLSIAEPELGVVFGRGPRGERLFPETIETVKAKNTDYREPRKVAQVPFLDTL